MILGFRLTTTERRKYRDEIKDFVKWFYVNVKVMLVKIFLPYPIGGENQKHNYRDDSEEKKEVLQ